MPPAAAHSACLASLDVPRARSPHSTRGHADARSRSRVRVPVLCIVYYRAGFGQQIVLAFIITCATFLALTVFTIFSKIDFSFLGPFLCCGIFVLMIWSLIMSLAFTIGGSSASWHLALAIVGVALFTGFIIYDTYMIVTRLGVDDYIIAAIELYLDVINMFLYVLQILTICGGGRN